MIDLTPIIKKALTMNHYPWTDGDFNLVCGLFESKGYTISFWEGEEDWATINLQGSWLGYLWNKSPLLLINREYEEEIVKIVAVSFPYLIAYGVENTTDKVYTLDHKELGGLMDLEILGDVFSIQDLWFYTI